MQRFLNDIKDELIKNDIDYQTAKNKYQDELKWMNKSFSNIDDYISFFITVATKSKLMISDNGLFSFFYQKKAFSDQQIQKEYETLNNRLIKKFITINEIDA